jgi:pilus assembly protein TadC
MSKRFWLTTSILGLLMGLPAALLVYNLGVFSPHSQGAADITLGMILLGGALVGLGAVIRKPMSVTAVVREMRRQA